MRSPTTSAVSINTWSGINLTLMRWLGSVTLICVKVYPMKVTFKVTGKEDTVKLKRPSKSVITPCVVPLTMTLAENIGSPVSPSLTKPTTVVWAERVQDNSPNENAIVARQRADAVMGTAIRKRSKMRIKPNLLAQDAISARTRNPP